MMMKHLLLLSLSICLSAFSTFAQSQELANLVQAQSGDIKLNLSEMATATNVLVEGRTVHLVGTDEMGTPISSTNDAPMFIVRNGGTLILDDVALKASATPNSSDATTAILVDDGALQFNYSSYEGERTFAIFARNSDVVVQSSGFENGLNALAVSKGTKLSILDSAISGFRESAVSARDPDTHVVLDEVRISHANRAISVTDGASLAASSVGLSTIFDAAILSISATVLLNDFAITDSPNIGVYAENPIEFEMQGGRITGPTGTAISLRGSGKSNIANVEITDANFGISVVGAGHNLHVSELDSVARSPEAIHIISGGGPLKVSHSTFLGGRAAFWTDNGGQVEIVDALLSESTQTSVFFQGGTYDTNKLKLSRNRFQNFGDTPNVYLENVAAEMFENLFKYDTLAINNAENQNINLGNNGFVGPDDTTIWNGSAYGAPPKWTNSFKNARSPKPSDANLVILATDKNKRHAHIAQLNEEFNTLQTELGVADAGENMATIALDASTLPAAPHTTLFKLNHITENGTVEPLGDVTPRDMPLNIRAGLYQIEFSSGEPHTIELMPHDTFDLALPIPTQPYALAVTDGKLTVGKSLDLRPQDEMRTRWESMWPGYFALTPNADRGYPVRRPEATATQIDAARRYARLKLEPAIQFLKSIKAGTSFGDLTEEATGPYDAAWQIVPVATDILMVAGDYDDAEFLAEAVTGIASSRLTGHLTTLMARASVHISLRQGDIAASPAVSVWQSLGNAPYSTARTKLSIALSAAGYKPATTALIKAMATERRTLEDPTDTDNLTIFRLIAHKYHPDVLKFSNDFLSAYDSYTKAESLARANPDSTKVKPDATFNGIYFTAGLDTALGYAQSYVNDGHQANFNIGIPWWSTLSLLPFQNPANVIDNLFGISAQDFHGRGDYALMSLGCRLMADLSGADRERAEGIYTTLLSQVVAATNDTQRPGAFAEVRVKASLSHCGVNQAALKNLESPENTDQSLFPTWMRHGFGTPEKFLPDFGEIPETSIGATATLAGYDPAILQPTLDVLKADDRVGLHAYSLFNAIADPSGLGRPGPFANGTDKRYFLQSIIKPNPNPLWLAGEVTLAPRLLNERKLFGISISTAIGNLGGLAGMISRAGEKMGALTADSGRGMIDKVVLRSKGHASQLAYIQSTGSGAHIYEMVEPIGSNENLYLDIYFKGADRGWTVTFPLFASPFGYEQIQTRGRLTLAD